MYTSWTYCVDLLIISNKYSPAGSAGVILPDGINTIKACVRSLEGSSARGAHSSTPPQRPPPPLSLSLPSCLNKECDSLRNSSIIPERRRPFAALGLVNIRAYVCAHDVCVCVRARSMYASRTLIFIAERITAINIFMHYAYILSIL